MPQYLIHAEAFNLDNSVYDTNDISTIRGGSYMLLDAIQRLPRMLSNRLVPITTAASKGVFAYEDEGDLQAQQNNMVLQVRRALATATGGHATFLVAVEKDGDDFGAVLARLEAAVRRQQWRMPTVAVPAYEATDQECYLDGWRPGVNAYTVDPDVADVKISAATQYRRQRGREVKHSLFRELFASETAGRDLCTKDLGELAADPSKGILNGKIAFFHADGNSFGRIRTAVCATPKARTAFDQRIQEHRRAFLSDLHATAVTDADFQVRYPDGTSALRLEILLWGGDECTLVIPAWKGLEVLQRFYRAMDGLEFDGVPMTHRATLIFCHHNAPILQIRRLAEDLLDMTKKNISERLSSALDADPALISLAPQDQALLLQRLSSARYGNAARYLVLESFDMLRGPLDQFLGRYYGGSDSSQLLLYADDLAELRRRFHMICNAASKGRVLELARALSNDDDARIADLSARMLSSISPDQREAVKTAIDGLTQENPAGWYLLADLWDYAEEWRG